MSCPHCGSSSSSKLQGYPRFFLNFCNGCTKTFVSSREDVTSQEQQKITSRDKAPLSLARAR